MKCPRIFDMVFPDTRLRESTSSIAIQTLQRRTAFGETRPSLEMFNPRSSPPLLDISTSCASKPAF